MSYEIVIKNTKKIENSLEKMGATGRGLYEKSLSLKNELNSKTLNSIRFIATIRNKLLHEDGFELSSELLDNLLNQCNSVFATLDTILISKSNSNFSTICNPTETKVNINTTNINERISNNSLQAICDCCGHLFNVSHDDIYRLEHYNVNVPTRCNSCLETTDESKSNLEVEDTRFKSKNIFHKNTILFLMVIAISYYFFK